MISPDNSNNLSTLVFMALEETTNFGRVKENDEGYLKVKYSF